MWNDVEAIGVDDIEALFDEIPGELSKNVLARCHLVYPSLK